MTSVNFCFDGKLIASSSFDGTIKIWSLLEKKELFCLAHDRTDLRSLSFTPNGKILASGADY